MRYVRTHNKSIAKNSKFVEAENVEKNLPEELRKVIYDTIHDKKVPSKQKATYCRISYQQLLNSCNPNLPFKFSSRHLIPLMQVSQNFSILEFQAKVLGFFVFRVPLTRESGPEKMLGLIFKLKSQWERISRLLEKYYSGGAEDKNLLRDIEEQLFVLVNIAAALRVSVFKSIERQR